MKKIVWVVIAVVALIAAALVLAGLFIPPFREAVLGAVGLSTNTVVVSSGDWQSVNKVAVGEELLANAETREDAEALAEQYGITLVRFRNGIATFHCEENPFDVIIRGRENGWAPLYPNSVITVSPFEEAHNGKTDNASTVIARPTKPSAPEEP